MKDVFHRLLEQLHPPHDRATQVLELASESTQAVERRWSGFNMVYLEQLPSPRLCRVTFEKEGIFDHFRWLTLIWHNGTPELTLVQRNVWRDREIFFHRRPPYLLEQLTPVNRVRVEELLRLGFDREDEQQARPVHFDTMVFGSPELLTFTTEELMPARAAS